MQPSIDLDLALLRHFGLTSTPDMLGQDLAPILEDDTPVRDAAIFGYHGRAVNVTGGRYVHIRGISGGNNAPLFDYTLMPTHMKDRFTPGELRADCVAVHDGFMFTKGCPVLKIGLAAETQVNRFLAVQRESMRNALYDTVADPTQSQPIDDADPESRMPELLIREMRRCDAAAEQYQRLALPE